VRAVLEGDADCPVLHLDRPDGSELPMLERRNIRQSAFPVTVCEAKAPHGDARRVYFPNVSSAYEKPYL
jgi:hypothetical protein